jgi:transitional endoplasmic reticulum ATPase
METVKAQLRSSVGLLLAFPEEAAQLHVEFNGILLAGAAGLGKTFLAHAVAGEYGLNLIEVDAGALAAPGSGSDGIARAFATARAHPPCLLLLDEFDAIARRRDRDPSSSMDRSALSELLTQLEAIRGRPDVIVVATTRDLQGLDDAVLRPGRFDRQVRVDFPDLDARRAIFAAQLGGRPCAPSLDLDGLATRSQGFSAAQIRQVVDRAAMRVLEAVGRKGSTPQIGAPELLAAIDSIRGQDRPATEPWSWDQLILPSPVKRELQEIQRLVEAPEKAQALGIAVPAGILLYGAPGTGKTTVARVLAAQAKASFYPVKGSDIVSKWVGESERNVADLFARARANVPSIIFIDEIDSLAATRSNGADGGAAARLVNQLLEEIDGLGGRPGVFVLGATNRPDLLDPALLRGGRLSRRLRLTPPDLEGRRAMLSLFTKAMPLAADVDRDQLAARTHGFSGADLQALCQQAGLQALIRDEQAKEITAADFTTAIKTKVS